MPQPKVLKQAKAALIIANHLYTAKDELHRSRLIAHLSNAVAKLSFFGDFQFEEVTSTFLDNVCDLLTRIIVVERTKIDNRRWNP